MENSKPEEYIILVDQNDKEIGVAEKITAHRKALLHRAFSVFVFRKNENSIELLLQKRNLKKYHGGGLWTNTCCSHPHKGEDLTASAQKRLKLEIGIDVPLKLIGKFHYIEKFENGLTENEIDHVLVGMFQGGEIHVNPEEVEDYCWTDPATLQQDLLDNPKKYTVWLPQALKLALTAYDQSPLPWVGPKFTR